MEGELIKPATILLRTMGFALVLGAAVAFVVAACVSAWEWLENPGGIFRDETGTNWGFVWDTAFSWFLPTFAYVAVAGAALSLCYCGVQWLRNVRGNEPED